MIEPTTKNLTIYQGATYQKSWYLTNTSDGSLYNILNWTARMQIRAKKKDSAYLLELTTENGGITLTVTAEYSMITLYISPTDTAALTSGGVYDLELVDPQGDVIRIMEGSVTLSTEVTR